MINSFKPMFLIIISLSLNISCLSIKNPISYPNQSYPNQSSPHIPFSQLEILRNQYPQDQYLVETATQSTQDQAIDEAKNKIAQSIKSELISKVKYVASQMIHNGDVYFQNEITKEITKISDFKHAELLQIDSKSTQCQTINHETTCFALAFLKKSSLIEKLSIDWKPLQIKVEELVRQLKNDQLSDREFSFFYNQLEQDLMVWISLSSEIESIKKGHIENFSILMKEIYEIKRRQINQINQIEISILPTIIDNVEIANTLTDILSQYVKQMQIRNKTSTSCDTKYGVQLRGVLTKNQHSKMLGKVSLEIKNLQVSLIKCPNQEEKKLNLMPIKAYEVYNQTVEDYLKKRLETEIFNLTHSGEESRHSQDLKNKLKEILKEVLAI
jgi:hypothetical protein